MVTIYPASRTVTPDEAIISKIYLVRKVMLDKDLAEMYGVETKRLNEQVRRNAESFRKILCFSLRRKNLKT